MLARRFSLRAATCWLLVSILSGVLPAASAGANPTEMTGVAPRAALETAKAESVASAVQDSQMPSVQAPAAPPLKHHHSRTWIAVIAAVAVGAGVAIIAGNRQSGKTAPTTPTATVGVGGASAGAP